MNNVEAYKELGGLLKEKLERQFEYLIYSGNMEGAWMTLGRLMAYKLIDKNDERLSKNYVTYYPKHKDWGKLFPMDMRKDTGYIPEWFFADVNYNMTTVLRSVERMGKRVEGKYECDMIYPARDFKIRIRQVSNAKVARDAVENIVKLMGVKLNAHQMKEFKEEAACGFVRIYEITIDDQVLSRYRDIGYIILSRHQSGVFTARLVLRTEVFKYYFISIEESIEILLGTFGEQVGIGNELRLMTCKSYDREIREQRELAKENERKVMALLNELKELA